ncbi:MAG: 5-formyltetrahydrofolate cyclo-ligase [Sphingomonadales bacterium]|nr:5-formyltetrahydrofolate cyclo-ligase [Sphingomonadales bacterium]MBK6491387.1 5-formyltetrahydrofolate cyclo-ligase [Sphingomonadales bacterium]MBK6721657.1 5-formyltetrahydrofolate cyclo-ligase [Sphingomonadales bacterium]
MTDKKKLRTDIRKRREEFVKSQLNGSVVSSGLPDSLKSLFRSANVVAGYVKLGSEVDPSDLISAAVDMGRTIALPCLIGRATDLVFRKWQPGDPMEQADFGFMQPLPSAEACNPDLILTPLVGFDRALNRLGQGAGYYDRAFAAFPDSLRIGIAWSIQECDGLMTDPWDMPLDAVLTEKEWITAPHSRIGA